MIHCDSTGHLTMLLYISEVVDVHNVQCQHMLVALTADSAQEQPHQVVTLSGMMGKFDNDGCVHAMVKLRKLQGKSNKGIMLQKIHVTQFD
jgi:hypothetical protein